MQKTALIPYAHLPRAHHNRHVLTSTVDVFGAAHWLLAERAPQPGGDVLPFTGNCGYPDLRNCPGFGMSLCMVRPATSVPRSCLPRSAADECAVSEA